MAKECKIEGCGKPARTRGWCSMHYGRVFKFGDPNIASRPIEEDDLSNLPAEMINFIKACNSGVIEKLLRKFSVAAIAHYYMITSESCYKYLRKTGVDYQQYGRRNTGAVTVKAAIDAGAMDAKAIAMFSPWTAGGLDCKDTGRKEFKPIVWISNTSGIC